MRRLVERVTPWAVIAATVALGVACLAAATSSFAGRGPRFCGFLTYQSGAVASLARADWPGFRAGLAVRDTIVSVGGAPVDGGPDIARRLAEVPEGATVEIVAETPAGARKAVRLPVAHLDGADLRYTFVLPFSIGVLYLLLGVAIFVVKRDAATALTLALCVMASAFYMTMFDAHTAWRFTRIWICYPMLGPISVHLFAIFPERRPRWARASMLGPLYAVALAVIAWRQVALDSAAASDPAAIASSLMLAVEFVIDLGLLASAFRSPGSATASAASVRNRARTTFVGMALTITVVIVWQFASRLGPPVMTADRAMLASTIFPLLIAYALLGRNLWDADAVLRASLIYAVATAAVLGVYFAGVAVLGAVAAPLVHRWSGSARAGAVASTLIAAAAFHPLRLRAQRLVDRLLIGDRRAVAEELGALASALPSGGDPSTVGEDAARRLQRLVGARGVALLSIDERGEALEVAARVGALPEAASSARVPIDGPLVAALGDAPVRASALPRELLDGNGSASDRATVLGAELLVPLRARGRLVGVAAFGPRRVGAYHYADLQALEQAAPTVALALDHARLLVERAASERLAALGAMAAVIVHEVKNPLGIIKVSAGSLRKRAGDEASKELCRCVESEVDRMDTTCRRLLDLARPPAPSVGPCDLGELVRSTVERVRPDLAAARVSVRCEVAGGAAMAADAEGMRQVLVNLLYNARDSMQPDGGEVAVRLEPREGAVALVVADGGRGMDEATRRQLFRPFFTTRHGGTGLGLAIVKRIVEEHRGSVQVESAPGAGARFTITLPA